MKEYSNIGPDSNVFLSHLSGDEADTALVTTQPEFLSHLSGDEENLTAKPV